MINNKRVLAIIPARGGSKGLPRKNIKMLNGKPLIGWTIEQGLSTTEIDTVVVSTDSEEIAEISRSLGAEVPFLRPSVLATDTATSISVVEHCIEFYKNELNQEFDIIVLLEATSPLREVNDLSRMLIKFVDQYDQCDAVISVGEVSEHPSIVKKINNNGFLVSILSETESVTRRQDNSVVYFPYCVAYIVKREVLLETQSFYPVKALPYLINRYQCYEIDDIYDFLAIENIMKFEWKL